MTTWTAVPAEVSTIAGRVLVRTSRAPQALFAYVAQPVLLLLLFSQVFHGVAGLGTFESQGYGSYLEFFVPSALGMAVVVAGLGAGVSTVTDIQSGILDKLKVSPVHRASIVVGRMAADVVRTIIQAVALLGVGFLLGARYHTAAGVVLAALFTTGAALTFGALSTALAVRLRNAEAVTAITNLVSLPLLFLSNALMPTTTFPTWLEWVARINPVSHLIDFNRKLLVLGFDSRAVAIAAAVLAIALTVAVATASRALGAAK